MQSSQCAAAYLREMGLVDRKGSVLMQLWVMLLKAW
jgi:hypothetical protein